MSCLSALLAPRISNGVVEDTRRSIALRLSARESPPGEDPNAGQTALRAMQNVRNAREMLFSSIQFTKNCNTTSSDRLTDQQRLAISHIWILLGTYDADIGLINGQDLENSVDGTSTMAAVIARLERLHESLRARLREFEAAFAPAAVDGPAYPSRASMVSSVRQSSQLSADQRLQPRAEPHGRHSTEPLDVPTQDQGWHMSNARRSAHSRSLDAGQARPESDSEVALQLYSAGWGDVRENAQVLDPREEERSRESGRDAGTIFRVQGALELRQDAAIARREQAKQDELELHKQKDAALAYQEQAKEHENKLQRKKAAAFTHREQAGEREFMSQQGEGAAQAREHEHQLQREGKAAQARRLQIARDAAIAARMQAEEDAAAKIERARRYAFVQEIDDMEIAYERSKTDF